MGEPRWMLLYLPQHPDGRLVHWTWSQVWRRLAPAPHGEPDSDLARQARQVLDRGDMVELDNGASFRMIREGDLK